jgi:hypothetical protein
VGVWDQDLTVDGLRVDHEFPSMDTKQQSTGPLTSQALPPPPQHQQTRLAKSSSKQAVTAKISNAQAATTASNKTTSNKQNMTTCNFPSITNKHGGGHYRADVMT